MRIFSKIKQAIHDANVLDNNTWHSSDPNGFDTIEKALNDITTASKFDTGSGKIKMTLLNVEIGIKTNKRQDFVAHFRGEDFSSLVMKGYIYFNEPNPSYFYASAPSTYGALEMFRKDWLAYGEVSRE
ncbi:MAG TPA: hypothetical protein VEP90_24725 [Methylomirabilota bacterium]|nr:hypothetical protein [Methylomirabilota bacterium]